MHPNTYSALLSTSKKVARENMAQATLEYVLVMAAFLSVIIGLGTLWRFGALGELQALAQSAASHLVETLSGLRDICLF